MSAESADKDRAQVRGAEIVESNAAIEARLNDKVFSLFALHQATQLLSSTLNPKLLAEMAVDVVIEISHSTNGALYLTDDRGAALRLAAAKSIEGKAFPSEYSSEVSFALAAGDQLRQPFLYTLPGEIGMALVAPLCPQGQFVGCFILQGRRKMEPWTEDDIENLGTLASHVGLCLQNARLHQQVLDQYEALKEAQAQLVQTEKLATMGQLLAGVAHELNNPLSVVLGQTALLRATAGNGPLVERAEKIANAAARSARIVQNFLAIARQRPPERQRVRLNRVIQDAVELLAYPLRVDNVEVRWELADDLPPLWADPHQLHQVAVNLISNAHQALRESSPPRWLTLTTRTDLSRGRVVLEVADTGPGIAPEIQTRIFEPFFTTKPPGQGTGLGLSLCQGIVVAHGGTIGVESQVGQGTVFVVELPGDFVEQEQVLVAPDLLLFFDVVLEHEVDA
ncbi:MAG: hypothetical protein HYZ81_01385, partial [Nitrospinae bacterium]|nr:hypothetical protein [Nitrospinota bacterium]